MQEGDDYLGADGDFFAVDGEGLVAPLPDSGGGGVGEVGVAAYGRNLLNSAVCSDQGFKDYAALDVGAARGFGIIGLDALVEKAFGQLGLEAYEVVIGERRVRDSRQLRALRGGLN